MFSRSARAGAGLLLAILAACSRPAPRAVERYALPPVENLTGEGSLEWMAIAIPVAVGAQLSGTPDATAVVVPTVHETAVVRPTRVVHASLTGRAGALTLSGEILDNAQREPVRVFSFPVTGAPEAADQIARLLSARPRPPATRQQEALRALSESYRETDPGRAAASAERAVAADPGFGAAAMRLAQLLAARGDRPAARARIEQALAQPNLPALERAQLQVMAAGLGGDTSAAAKALESLADEDPSNADLLRPVAARLMQERRFGDAVRAFQKIQRADPSQAENFNLLAYAQAQAGDVDGALRSIEEYRKASNNNPNVSDSKGEILFIAGRFEESEKAFREVFDRTPQFLGGLPGYKAAVTRLMRGDLAGGDQLFKQFKDARLDLQDPAVPLHEANWLAQTGRAAEGERLLNGQLEKLAPQVRVAALLQLALWQRMRGNAAAAQQYVQRIGGGQKLPGALAVSALSLQPSAAAEVWSQRAQQMFAAPGLETARDFALGAALVLDGKAPAAAAPLQAALERTNPPDDRDVRALFAISLAAAGKTAEAARLFTQWPVPAAPDAPLAAYTFSRQFEVRGMKELAARFRLK